MELDVRTRQQLLDELPGVYKRVLARAIQFAWDRRVVAALGDDAREAAEDLVQIAVERTLRGQRTWNPDQVDLATHLIGACRSIASSLKKQGSLRAGSYDDEIAPDLSSRGTAPRQSQTPAEQLEDREAVEALEMEIIEAAGDDEALLDVAQEIIDGATRPQEISESLELDRTTTEVRLRKLRRRVRRNRKRGDR